jgi:transglutaminase-like putative cysteine protease
MTVDPAPSHHGTGPDAFGNSRVFFAVTQPHKALAVRATSRLRVAPRPAALAAYDTPPWEAVRERVRYAAGRPYEPAAQFAPPSPYVPRLQALRELAEGCFPPGMPVAAGAVALMHRCTTNSPTRARAPTWTRRWPTCWRSDAASARISPMPRSARCGCSGWPRAT